MIALINPLDRANNEAMIVMGLNLLTVAMEAGADHLHNYNLLMPLVKNELCRALLQVSTILFTNNFIFMIKLILISCFINIVLCSSIQKIHV